MDSYAVVLLLVLLLAVSASSLVLLLCSPLRQPLGPAQDEAPPSYFEAVVPISREAWEV